MSLRNTEFTPFKCLPKLKLTWKVLQCLEFWCFWVSDEGLIMLVIRFSLYKLRKEANPFFPNKSSLSFEKVQPGAKWSFIHIMHCMHVLHFLDFLVPRTSFLSRNIPKEWRLLGLHQKKFRLVWETLL